MRRKCLAAKQRGGERQRAKKFFLILLPLYIVSRGYNIKHESLSTVIFDQKWCKAMYEDHLSMNPSPSGSTINSRRGGYVFALSRTPSIEDSQTQSIFGNSYATSSPGLLAEHHGQISSTSTSRRSSISNNATTKHTIATLPQKRVRKRDRMLQFAKMKNPTLSIQITPEWIRTALVATPQHLRSHLRQVLRATRNPGCPDDEWEDVFRFTGVGIWGR